MFNNQMNTEIKYDVDNADVSKAVKANERIANSISDIAQESNKATSKQLSNSKRITDSLRNSTELYERQARSIKASGADLAGDIASSTAGLRGAIDVFSDGQAVIVSGALEVGEALADLGEFLPLAKAQFNALGGSIIESAGGAGKAALAMGAVGLALGALVVVFNEVTASAREQAEALNATIEAERRIRSEIAEGLTSEQALENVQSLNREIDQQRALLDELEAQYASFESQAGALGGALAKVFSDQEEALASQIATQKELIGELEGEVTAYERAIDRGLDSTQKATQNEKALDDARQANVEITRMVTNAEKEKERASTSAYEAEIASFQTMLSTRVDLQNQATQATISGASMGGTGARAPLPTGGLAGRNAGATFSQYLQGLQRAVTNNNNLSFTVNGAQNPRMTANAVLDIMNNTGIFD